MPHITGINTLFCHCRSPCLKKAESVAAIKLDQRVKKVSGNIKLPLCIILTDYPSGCCDMMTHLSSVFPEMFGKILQRGFGLGLLFTFEINPLFYQEVSCLDCDLERLLRLALRGQLEDA